MKNNLKVLVSLFLFGSIILIKPPIVGAVGLNTPGKVEVTPSDKTNPLDPENPLESVDPGPSPSTEGTLRLDFVSYINFADAKITKTNRKYDSIAQLFHDKTSARGSYVQVTDLREGNPGWSLQLKQETQFRNKDNVELSGAVLSFDKGWANSGGTGQAPSVFSDAILINTIGSSYSVASAARYAGNGTWMVSFGASETNENGQNSTLSSLKDKNGKEVIDETFSKPLYSNSAVSLSVPDKTTILPGDYGTTLTWILQAAP